MGSKETPLKVVFPHINSVCINTTKDCLDKWQELTTDPVILEYVSGCKIDFESFPIQDSLPHIIKMNSEENSALRSLIESFLREGVIRKTFRENGDYINNVFLREKRVSDQSEIKYRMILNVKSLNKHVKYQHFKMSSLETCLNLLSPNCFMGSLDLKNAYHSVPMDETFRKYFKFEIDGQFYEFCTLPQGFSSSPRIFTKIMKPVLSHLHNKGILICVYIDDYFVVGISYEECAKSIKYTFKLLKALGFRISEKSSLIPSQVICHLGFVIDSCLMTVSISADKRESIVHLLKSFLREPFVSVRHLS